MSIKRSPIKDVVSECDRGGVGSPSSGGWRVVHGEGYEPRRVRPDAIRANVERGVERLKGLEPALAGPVKAGRVKIAGGSYDLLDGKVTVVG